jgi:hypothetical protein
MTYVLIRHKVVDFGKWKLAYDGNLPARQRAGLNETHLLHNVQNHEEVVLLFEAADLQKAMEFCNSADLRATMQQAGVIGTPDIVFLSR